MPLRPAVLHNGHKYTGNPDDTHITVMKAHNIAPDAKHIRGFVNPQGKFMSRSEAKLWLKQYDKPTYEKWTGINGDGEKGELHSQDLHEAKEKTEGAMDLSKMKCLVIDLGLFPENACRIARDVAETWYWTPHQDAFPEPFQSKIGEGLEGIERIGNYHDYLDKADFIFVPDTMCAGDVEWMKRHGYPVAGAGISERLELDRWYGRGVQEKNNLPIQETHRIKGITALRAFTKEHKDYWVKIDAYRGLEESWSYTDEKDCEQTIDKIAYKLGPYKEDIVFICEAKLDGQEPGIDGITRQGELVYPCMIGYEGKGVGIIERAYKTKDDLPESAQWVYEGFAPEFKKNKTDFFFSFEYMIGKDRIPYVIDPSIRLAAPGVAAIQSELFDNYTEVIYGLATGKNIAPIIKWKYAAAAAMESSAANESWVNISFPKEIRQWVKLRMAVKHKGEYWAIPKFDSIGTVSGFGNTIKECLDLVKERAEQVQGKRLSKGITELEKIQESIAKGRECGIEF
jgi:phosphoribosylamine-glycine ligase